MSYAELVGVWVTEPVGSPAVPCSTAVQVDWPRGSDGTIVLRLIDALGEPVVLGSGDQVTLDITESSFAQTLRSLPGAAAGDAGRYVFTLVPDDTRDTPAGALIYAVSAKIAGKWQQVVAPGYFVTTPAVPG